MKKLIALSIVTFAFATQITESRPWGWHHGWHGGWHRPWYSYDYGIDAGLVTAAAINNANRQPDTIVIQDNDNNRTKHLKRINDLEDQNDDLKRRVKKLEATLEKKSNDQHK